MILLPLLMLTVSLPVAASVTEGRGELMPLPPPPSASEPPVELAQMTIEQRVIIRVPMVRPGMPQSPEGKAPRGRTDLPPPPPAKPMKWEERKGPKCLQLGQVRAAMISSSHGVDLVLRDATRMRARLSRECRPEDLYSGFYIQPNEDGSLCAGRDRLLARSGANCRITEFRRLMPEK